jgi:hypothetical protein
MMKKFIILIIFMAILGGCGKSNYRGNATQLKESPCAGCWGEEDVINLRMVDSTNG